MNSPRKSVIGLVLVGFVWTVFGCADEPFPHDYMAQDMLLTDIDFADPNLQQAVLQSGVVLASQVENLDVRWHGIDDLGGLEHLFALRDLMLSGNTLASIQELASLKQLRALYLDHVPLNDTAPLSKLIRLRSMNLESTGIDSGMLSNLSGLTELESLNLSGNHGITDISVLSGLSLLNWLSLMHCEVSSLEPLTSMTGIQSLFLSGNQITSIDALASMSALEWLYAQNNEISSIEALKSTLNLRVLDISENPVTDLSPIADRQRLEELYVVSNGITDVSDFPVIPSLRILDLGDNDIAAGIERLMQYGHLESLGLRGNGNLRYEDLLALQEALPNTVIELPDQWIPAVPTGLTTNWTGEHIELWWDSTDSADYYRVYYGTSPGVGVGDMFITDLYESSTAYQEIVVNETYYFRVVSVKGERESEMSEEVSVTVQAPLDEKEVLL